MEVYRFVQEIGIEEFFLCRVINHLKIKFCEINTLVASYLLALVTFGNGINCRLQSPFQQ